MKLTSQLSRQGHIDRHCVCLLERRSGNAGCSWCANYVRGEFSQL